MVSDVDGKFSIICHSPNPTLIFEFIGFKTIELIADNNYLTVIMENDEALLNEKIRMGMFPNYTAIGFNSGVNYTPIGGQIRNSLPMLFRIKMLTKSTITYRTDLSHNELIDLRINRNKIIDRFYGWPYFNLEFGYNRRKIAKNKNVWNTEEINVVPEAGAGRFLFRLGYGAQSFNDKETLKSNQGIIFGFERYFSWHADILATAKKWNTYWQTEVKFTKRFKYNDFEWAVKFETLGTYRELDLLLLYRIHY